MKFKVSYFSRDLQESVLKDGNASVILFAENASEAVRQFHDEDGHGWGDCKVTNVSELPMVVYYDNVELRGTPAKKGSNFLLDSKDERWMEFFAFEGEVHYASHDVWYKAVENMFVWNGRFDWSD